MTKVEKYFEIGEARTEESVSEEIVITVEEVYEELCNYWNVDPENFTENYPITVNISNESKYEEQEIFLLEPEKYLEFLKATGEKKVTETALNRYPAPAHHIPEELGHLIGDIAPNRWKYSEGLVDKVRDELHGSLGIAEYFPEFLDYEIELVENHISTLKDRNSSEHVRFLNSTKFNLFPDDNSINEEYTADETIYEDLKGITPQTLTEFVINNSDRNLSLPQLNNIRNEKLRHDVTSPLVYLVSRKLAKDINQERNEVSPEGVINGDIENEVIADKIDNYIDDISDRLDIPATFKS